jgi:SAM-dependent methyltransferase
MYLQVFMQTTQAEECLKKHRELWQNKPVLQEIYHSYYMMIKNVCIEGLTLEIGGGSGNFKQNFPSVIATDIVALPWLDIISDAQVLPFRNACIANIVMIDVLHHIEDLTAFFREVERILKPGGRIILLEPAITPVSGIVLHLFHPEPIDMGQNPLHKYPADPGREPFDANQALPTLLFGRYKSSFLETFSSLRIVELKYHDLFVYPLSGGFRSWCFIPYSLIQPLLLIEQRLVVFLGPLMAFRLFCVIEKKAGHL